MRAAAATRVLLRHSPQRRRTVLAGLKGRVGWASKETLVLGPESDCTVTYLAGWQAVGVAEAWRLAGSEEQSSNSVSRWGAVRDQAGRSAHY